MKTPRMTIISLIALAVAIAVLPGAANAQTNFMGGIHFNGGYTQGELKDQIDRNAYGIGGQIFFAPHKSPFAIGFELGYMNYGSESRKEPFSTTIPDVTVDVETTNNIVQGFLVLRGQMPQGPIQLYGDALVGFNYLFTETKISDDGSGSETIASTTNRDDAAFAYGFGGGLMVPVYTQKDGSRKPLQVLIDGGVRYIYGDEAEYLKEGSIRRESGAVIYDPVKSKTDMMRLHIGVMVRF